MKITKENIIVNSFLFLIYELIAVELANWLEVDLWAKVIGISMGFILFPILIYLRGIKHTNPEDSEK